MADRGTSDGDSDLRGKTDLQEKTPYTTFKSTSTCNSVLRKKRLVAYRGTPDGDSDSQGKTDLQAQLPYTTATDIALRNSVLERYGCCTNAGKCFYFLRGLSAIKCNFQVVNKAIPDMRESVVNY